MEATIDFVRAGGTVGEWTSIIAEATGGRYSVTFDVHTVGTNGSDVKASRPIRIVLGKAGLDGHTNAIKLIALACRDAGMEVVFAGTHLLPESLIKAAVEEDAGLLGVSCLSGAHLSLARELLAARAECKATHLKILFGGTIPTADRHLLAEMGVTVVDASAGIPQVVRRIIEVGST
jgi:(2R)-ethylmalonyl-CoA mutase